MRRCRKHLRLPEAEAALVESQGRLFQSLFMQVSAQNSRYESRRRIVELFQ